MINRLIKPTRGAIYVDGKDISKEDEIDLRRNIGYVIQSFNHSLLKYLLYHRKCVLYVNMVIYFYCCDNKLA